MNPVVDLVESARQTAVEMHNQCCHLRSDGEPYWRHPERVVGTLRGLQLDSAVLAAAWLHDVAEDCPNDAAGCETVLRELESKFGLDVASLVREVTNFSGPDATMEQKQAKLQEHARRMTDRAKWIKLADRLDNISGMLGWSAQKQRRYAEATHRLLDALRPWPQGSEVLAAEIAQVAESRLNAEPA